MLVEIVSLQDRWHIIPNRPDSWGWWHIALVSALRRKRQVNLHVFEDSFLYIPRSRLARESCLKTHTEKTNKQTKTNKQANQPEIK